MTMKNDFIQLPPLPRDLDADGIKILWEYVKMPPEGQERLRKYMDMTAWSPAVPAENSKVIYDVPVEGIEGFQNALKEMIGNLIVEISQFACWLYHQIYVQGEAPEDLLAKHPEAGDMIRIMSEVFEEMMKEDGEETDHE